MMVLDQKTAPHFPAAPSSLQSEATGLLGGSERLDDGAAKI